MYTRSILLTTVFAFAACEKFDSTRVAPASQSVGQELFGIMCDRLVAQNFPEDIEGKRFERVCHPGPNGKFADPPTAAKEPATDAASEKARIALARVEALAKRRYDLIKSFDTMLPEAQPGYLDGMRQLLVDMTPLYDKEMPNLTGSTSALLKTLEQNEEAINALTRVINRDGYRPIQASAGLLANLATRPDFADMLDGTLRIFEPGGDNDVLLGQLLVAGRDELARVDPTVKSGSLGLISRVLLKEDDSLFQGGGELYIAKREACGVVGFGPGVPMGNACSAMDPYGRFLDQSGKLLSMPTPFSMINVNDTTRRDNFGRALDSIGRPLYQYVNLQKAILPGMIADSRPLMAPEKPLVHDLLLNLTPVLGDLSAKVEQRPGDISRRFDIYATDTSPLVDLAIAIQPVLKALGDDDFASLDVLSKGLKKNETNAARLVAALVNAKNMANADTYANPVQTSPLWDELLDLFAELADARDASGNRVPLLEEILEAFTHPDVQNLPAALAGAIANKDIIDYDPMNVGGPAKNFSSTTFNPSLPVNRAQADIAGNKSIFQRLAQIIHETRGVRLCNKDDAFINAGPLSLLKYDECGMFDVKDMAVFFLQAIVVNGNGNDELAKTKGKGRFPMTDVALNQLLKALGYVTKTALAEGAFSAILAEGAGIPGMGIYPTPESLARMIFVRHTDANAFVKGLSEAAPSQACPLKNVGASSPLFGLRACSADQTIAERVPGTFFAFETNGFYPALRALGRPFVKYDKEDLFLKVMTIVTKHWPSKTNGDCNSNGAPEITANYCSRSNYVSFEPLLAKIFAPESDVLAALRLASIDLEAEGGVRKLAPLVRAFVSREDNQALVDRRGEWPKRNDGLDNNYTTPARLFAKAMGEIDARRKLDVTGFQQWKTARGGLVDQLFAWERPGDVATTRLKSSAQTKLLPELLAGLAEEMRTKKANGSFDKLVEGGLHADVKDMLTNPLLAGALKTLALLRKDGKAEQAMLKTLYAALDPNDSSRFMASMASLADTLQTLNDEGTLRSLLPVLAPALEPTETGAARATLALLSQTAKMDPDHRLPQLVSRLVSPLPCGTRTPLEVISATIAEVSRMDPTKSDPFTADDTRRVLAETREFLANKESGLARMIDVIQHRNVK